nr:PREDICTED: butyrophilin subfamily 2 member A2-like isoform X1 [Lepisosteus oculatus]
MAPPSPAHNRCKMGNFLWFCAELLFLLSLSQALETGQVKVVVPSSSMLAIKDSSIVLPCHLEPETSAAGMEVRWFKGSFTDFLYLHKNGKETVGSVYKGRVSLVHPDLEKGNVSLLLKDITASDEGIYTCHVSPGQYFDERSLNMLVRERVFECSHPVRLYLSVIVIPAVLALFCFWASLLYAQRKKQGTVSSDAVYWCTARPCNTRRLRSLF